LCGYGPFCDQYYYPVVIHAKEKLAITRMTSNSRARHRHLLLAT
jgi:hypothetical protein